jgi:anti-sigma B factor antagonist
MHSDPMPGTGGSRVPEFAVRAAPLAEGGTEVAVFGDFDLATADEVRDALEPAIAASGEVQVDLRACTFIDSSGVGVIVACALRLKETGRTLRVRGARQRVRRTFEIAGLAGRESVRLDD